MNQEWKRFASPLGALIVSLALLPACSGTQSVGEPKTVLTIPVEIGERFGSWQGTLTPGDYDIWLHYRGSYSERARVCFMLKVSGEGAKEEELKGWMADVLAQKTGVFLPAGPGQADGFERPLGKTLKVKTDRPVLLEAMIFLGPGAQVRMEEVRLLLRSGIPEARAEKSI